jgi:hypothetical protein
VPGTVAAPNYGPAPGTFSSPGSSAPPGASSSPGSSSSPGVPVSPGGAGAPGSFPGPGPSASPGSPSSPGYVPPSGWNYRGESGGGRASGSPEAVPAAAVVAAGPTDSATVARAGSPLGSPADSRPSIIRIPVSEEGLRASTAAGATGPIAPDPPPRDIRDLPEVKAP